MFFCFPERDRRNHKIHRAGVKTKMQRGCGRPQPTPPGCKAIAAGKAAPHTSAAAQCFSRNIHSLSLFPRFPIKICGRKFRILEIRRYSGPVLGCCCVCTAPGLLAGMQSVRVCCCDFSRLVLWFTANFDTLVRSLGSPPTHQTTYLDTTPQVHCTTEQVFLCFSALFFFWLVQVHRSHKTPQSSCTKTRCMQSTRCICPPAREHRLRSNCTGTAAVRIGVRKPTNPATHTPRATFPS